MYNMSNGPLSHTPSPRQSPTIPQSGGLMNIRHHLRVQHPGYSPHTTPHQSPNVVYTPTTSTPNVFQFHEGMHHHANIMEDNSGVTHSPHPLRSPNVAMHSPNVAMHSPNVTMHSPNLAMHSPNVPLQSPNVPLHSPNVPQSPSANQHYRNPRFAFPPSGHVDTLSVKTELGANFDEKSTSPLALSYQDANQASPASSTHSLPNNLRYPSSNNAEVMLSAMNYSETEMLREGGFDVASNPSGLAENLMGPLMSQQNSNASGYSDLFDSENSIGDSYMDQSQDLQMHSDSFSESSTAFSMSDRDLSRTSAPSAASVSAGLTSHSQGKLTSGKTKAGRGRSARSPGHRPNLQCQICGKKFNNSSAIAKHKLTHSDERKYACNICSKAFKRQDHLNGHMLTHRDKKPYECKFENCDKSYSDARSLRRHLENHHSMIEQATSYSGQPRLAQYSSGFQASTTTTSGGQYFQFDHMQQQQQQQQQAYAADGASSNSDNTAGHWQQFRSGDRSPGYIQQVSPISPAPGTAHPHSPLSTRPQQRTSWTLFDEGPKSVECSLCHRRFKNVPALNGHMRLHGGYFKKEDVKPTDEKSDLANKETYVAEPGQMLPPVQTTFSQKTKTTFQKPVPPPVIAQPKTFVSSAPQSQATDLSRKVFDTAQEDMRRLQQAQKQVLLDDDFLRELKREKEPLLVAPVSSLASITENNRLSFVDHISGTQTTTAAYLTAATHQALQTVLAVAGRDLPQAFVDAGSAAMTLAEMSSISGISKAMQQEHHQRELQQHHQQQQHQHDLPASLLERRLLGYSDSSFSQHPKYQDERRYTGIDERKYEDIDYSEHDKQISIKSPTTGTLFSFPERAPSQPSGLGANINNNEDTIERKRHLSADADKFTSPKRISAVDIKPEGNDYWHDSFFPRPKSPTDDCKRIKPRDDPLSRSCPSGTLFRNPGDPPSTAIRPKRKQRPEPLFIPPHVNHFGFHSRLRSPRLWDKDIGCTPPPYTPPPMLSPVRRGGGLFWTIHPYRPMTPKSAPITPKLAPARQSSVSAVEQAYDEVDVEEEPPPATDIKPHVNVGKQYQAELPECRQYHISCSFSDWEDLVWCPDSEGDNSLDEIQCYMDFACCAAVPGSSTNKEYAIHLLHYSKGDIQKALTLLMLDTPKFPRNHVLSTYKYDETEHWSTKDIELFHQALVKYGEKDFYSIGREVTKSTKQCVEFYYLWKKVCPDEYKRLRILRRKKEQEELYNLRSKSAEEAAATALESGNGNGNADRVEPEVFRCEYPECTATFSSRSALTGHVRVHVTGKTYHQTMAQDAKSDSNPSPCSEASNLDDFPCKVCGKVFTKVKSRNAHMKRHRTTDSGTKVRESKASEAF